MMIATVGPCLPVDLLAATGHFAGPLAWRLDRPTPRADTWLESRFPRWARSILEDWADGRYDDHDAVVFSRGEDVAQRLYYYICELQRRGIVGGPRAVIFDVAKIPRDTSEAHTIAAVRSLAAELGLDETALAQGIAATNERRLQAVAAPEAPTCLLPGTPPPQGLLHQAVQDAGFTPIGHTLSESWADPGPVVDAEGDPATAIGRQVHARRNEWRGFGDAARQTVELAAAVHAAAAILWYTEEDEAGIWQLPHIRAALAEAGVPTLVMTRRDERGSDGAPGEIQAFLQGLSS